MSTILDKHSKHIGVVDQMNGATLQDAPNYTALSSAVLPLSVIKGMPLAAHKSKLSTLTKCQVVDCTIGATLVYSQGVIGNITIVDNSTIYQHVHVITSR
jgi:hypothetical protein